MGGAVHFVAGVVEEDPAECLIPHVVGPAVLLRRIRKQDEYGELVRTILDQLEDRGYFEYPNEDTNYISLPNRIALVEEFTVKGYLVNDAFDYSNPNPMKKRHNGEEFNERSFMICLKPYAQQ